MKKIGALVLVIVVVLVGKWFIDSKTVRYEETVSKSLAAYYISGNTNELQPIVALLDKYKFDENLRKEIQNYSLDVVNSWYTYLDGKYNCSKSDLNSCMAQVEEYQVLDTKLKGVYSYKCKDGFTILLPSAYTSLLNSGLDKMTSLNKIIKSPSAKDQKDSETIRNEKCDGAVSCTSCRGGFCSCTYIAPNKKSETLICKDKNTIPST